MRVDPATGEVDASSAKQVAFADLSDVSLVVRAAPGYGQKVPDLKGQTLEQIEAAFSGSTYGYFLRGTYELEDGTAVEAVFGARFEDGAFVDDTDVGLFAFQQSVGNSFADLAPDGVDPFVTASQNSDDELKTDFVIDIAAAAEALAGEDATSAEQIAAQLWLTRNIGVQPAEDVDGEVVVGVAVRTRDSGNLGTDPAEDAGVSAASPGQITVDIESRADAVAIAAEAEGVLSAPIESAEVSSSADGIELLSTDGDGLFSGISAAGGGAVDNSQFDGLIIGVSLDAGASSQTAVLADLSQIALEVRNDADSPDQIVVVNEFTPKLNDAGDAYLFNVPTLGASHSLHIVTPSYFDGSIELSVQTLSQGSAGDTAISEAVSQTLTVLSQGDGVDLKVGSATGVEDSPVPVRLPISVTRKDVSEEIADVTLSLVTAEFGDAVDAISYVSRVETRMTDIAVTVDAGLVASDARFTDAAALRVDPATGEVDASSAKQVAFADLSDVSLVVRAAPGYGQKVPDLKGQTLEQIEDAFSGSTYGYFLRGTYELDDGTAVEAVFGARFEDGAFVDDTDVGLFAFQQSVGNSFADLAPDGVDPFVTASQNSDDELKTDFVIDIAAAAEALAGEDATSAEKIAAQLWLTRNIGVKPAEDVDGEVVVGVAVRTRDSGNLGTDPAEDAGVSAASPGQITVDIESRADAVAIAAEAEGVLSAPIQSAEVSSSADGIELLSTDSDGLFSGISAAGGGAVDNSQFDGLIIGVTLDAGASSQTAVLADLSQIALEVRAADPEANPGDPDQIVVVNEFTPKLNDAGDAYLFNVPTLGASHSLHIVTPSYFDGSIELSVQTLSQGSAGDTAISEAVTQTLTVLSQGDGVDLKVGSATGVEDSPVPVRLPISVTRKDVSEEIADVTLSLVTSEFGDAVDAISYVSRVETRMTDIAVTVDAGLVASDATFTDAAALRVDPATGEVDASSAKQVAFADLSDVSLVVRAAPGYGQKVPDLKGKTLAQIEDGFSGEVYGYFLRGTYELDDGTEVEAVFGARLEDGAFVDDTDVGLFAFQQSVGNSFADLAPDGVDPFVTASQNSDDELKTDFVIDIAAAAEALAGEDATSAEQIAAQLWLTRNIGVKPAENLFGELTYDVSVRTRDSGNLGDTPARRCRCLRL